MAAGKAETGRGTYSSLLAVEGLGVTLAQCPLPHVHEPHGALAAAVRKGVALVRVELCGRDHLRTGPMLRASII